MRIVTIILAAVVAICLRLQPFQISDLSRLSSVTRRQQCRQRPARIGLFFGSGGWNSCCCMLS